MASNFSEALSPPDSSIAEDKKYELPYRFLNAIWTDLQDPMSRYDSDLIPDLELRELAESCAGQLEPSTPCTSYTVPLSPKSNLKHVTMSHYENFRLQEFKTLRDKFPDLQHYRVERAKTEEDRKWHRERFLVQVGATGYFMKKSTLYVTSAFFRTMFSIKCQEIITGRCKILTTAYMFPEDVVAAIMDFLCGIPIDYDEHFWIDVTLAGDYLGCDTVKQDVDAYLIRNQTISELEEAAVVLHQMEKIPMLWDLPRTANMCVEVIKSNLHFLIADDAPNTIIDLLSFFTVKDILQDSRLRYFTTRQRRKLIERWERLVRSIPSNQLQQFENLVHDSIDRTENTCTCFEDVPQSFPDRSERNPDQYERRLDIEIPFLGCHFHMEPYIIVAGGTGWWMNFSNDGKFARNLTPSKSLMAYSMFDNAWHFLPALPVGMLKPVLATNNVDQIYVIDCHPFRLQGLIQHHCLFTLNYHASKWHWNNINFDIPAGIHIFKLENIFYVMGTVYLIGVGRVYEEVIVNWDEGPDYVESLVRNLKKNDSLRERGTVFLLIFSMENGIMESVKFLFHVHRKYKGVLHACVKGKQICIEAKRGSLLQQPLTVLPVVAVYSCEDGSVEFTENKRTPKEFDILMPNPEHPGVIAVDFEDLGGSNFSYLQMYRQQFQMDIFSMSYPPSSLVDENDPIRSCHSIMMAVYHTKVFFIGGWSAKAKTSTKNFLAFNLPHVAMPEWKALAPLPVAAAHGGAVSTHFVRHPLSHHLDCPHCRRYPQDVLLADMSGLNLPPNYEANLMSTYPP